MNEPLFTLKLPWGQVVKVGNDMAYLLVCGKWERRAQRGGGEREREGEEERGKGEKRRMRKKTESRSTHYLFGIG